MSDVVVIVQARMSSTRFPGKVLAPLSGKPVINRVLESACRADVGEVVMATVVSPVNQPLISHVIANFGQRPLVRCVTGWSAENDVLERYYNAVRYSEPKAIVRVTGDCPLIDHRTIRELVSKFLGGNMPYIGRANAPDGNDCEVFSYAALAEAQAKAKPHEREHVTTYMRNMPGAIKDIPDRSTLGIGYSVNEIEDLHICERLIRDRGEGARWEDYCDSAERLFMGLIPKREVVG